MERYRVQFYTERSDGVREWCIADFRDEAATGKSPIVDDGHGRNLIYTDLEEARRVAATFNAAEPRKQ